MRGSIVGISGGDLLSITPLNKYAIECTGKENTHVLFIPTASGDAEGYIESICSYYEKLGCTVSALCLISKSYETNEIEVLIEDADLFYICGGDTENMLKIWKKFGVDEMLIKSYENGKVLTGISAGAICWFKYAFSDSEYFKNPDNWNYKLVNCLNMFDYAICPHYNESGRDSFDIHLAQLPRIDAIALDNDTAIIVNPKGMFIKKSCENANAYLIKNVLNGIEEIELKENELF